MNQLQISRLLKLGGKEWVYFLVAYLMTIMATYLTGVWELSITHASQIMNVYSGTVVILPVVMNRTLRCMRSLKFTVFVSKIAFVLGLMLMIISAHGTCKKDETLCISTRKKILFYIALFLLAVAVSAHETWSEKYLKRYKDSHSPKTFCGRFAYTLLPFGALTAVAYVSPWWVKFFIPSISAELFFFPLSHFSDDINEDLTDHAHDDQHDNVENEFLSTLHAVYVCMCSILVNVVFTVGNTFFILQAIDLDPQFWIVPIAVVSLPVIKESVKTNLSCVTCDGFPFGLIASMVFATLCCVTAAKVETRRLSVVVSEGVVDDSETIIPMTIFWLVPQYVLLGLAEKSLDDHVEFGLKEVMIGKTQGMGKIIKAAGFYCGVLSVYVVGQLKPSWIQDTVNTSRLDNYYWLLAALSAVNLVLFVLITVIIWFVSNRRRELSRALLEGSTWPVA